MILPGKFQLDGYFSMLFVFWQGQANRNIKWYDDGTSVVFLGGWLSQRQADAFIDPGTCRMKTILYQTPALYVTYFLVCVCVNLAYCGMLLVCHWMFLRHCSHKAVGLRGLSLRL